MTTALVPRRQHLFPTWSLLGVGIVLSAGLAGAVFVADHVNPDDTLHEVALFGHLACLVLGFGAVLAVDWVGLLWLLGHRTLPEVLETAGNVQVPIWIGLAGLLVSGVLLEPDLTGPWTRLKLVLVLVVIWNGLLAGALHRALSARAGNGTPRLLIGMAALSTLVSQAGWWGSMTIGFLNH